MNSTAERDCAVCLQKCHHPTQLPCGHIFCFLCVKGVAIQNRKCALCRAEIPLDYLDHPVLLEKCSPEETVEENSNVDYQWYYEGRNGWWKYDERSNSELEAAFSAGEANCMLLLAGAMYCIDFQNMMQVRRNDHTRRRRVRRDTPLLPVKGIAGIKMPSNNSENKPEDEPPEIAASGEDNVIEIVDSDDSDEPEDSVDLSPQSEEVDEVVDRLSAISVRGTASSVVTSEEESL